MVIRGTGVTASCLFACAVGISLTVSEPALGHSACVPQLAMLLGTGETGNGRLGASADLSADGNTLIVGAPSDNGLIGAAFVFVRSGGVWSQQGGKLVPTGGTGAGQFGHSVALSDDGNTALIGALADNGNKGAAYAFVRSAGVWSQQGGKILPVGPVGALGIYLYGHSVALSADGNTGIVGSITDGDGIGAAYVIVRSAGVWAQQAKRLPTGGVGNGAFGSSVALSSDGNTAVIGASSDNSSVGAAYVHVRAGTVWSQQQKLTATGGSGAAQFGVSASLSADGNTLAAGANADNGGIGAAYAFTRAGTVWSQQGGKIVPSGGSGNGFFGGACSLSADGNTLAVGAGADASSVGAAYILVRSGGAWSQQGSKLTPTGGTGSGTFGVVALNSSAGTLAVGAPNNNSSLGTAYVFGIEPGIAFTMQPVGQHVGVVNGSAMFTLAASSDAPLSYQWRRNGVSLSNGPIVTGAVIAGATTPSLSISNVTKADNAAAFDCVVTNACATTRSDPAGLGFGALCPGDFNVSGSKSVQDLFDYLAVFFATCP